MVVIFVKSVDGSQLSLDLRLKNSVRSLKRRIQRAKDLPVSKQRLIFGGRILKDNETLASYNIQKECCVQLFHIGGNNSNESQSPSSVRTIDSREPVVDTVPIPESLRFGDLILVQLIEGRNLKKSDFWTGSSDPYGILAIQNHSAKSKIIKRNLNPRWNELFIFTMPETNDDGSDNAVISILVFDYNTFTPDDFLGSIELSIKNVKTETILDLWLPLNHVETGEIHLKLRRFTLASPAHLKIAAELATLERSIRVSDLQNFGISLQQLVGEEAWVCADLSNPAIEHLVSVLLNESIEWTTMSLNRIESILAGQHILPTRGLPTRYIWFGGLSFLGSAGTNDAAFTKESFLRSIEQYAVPKCCFIPRGEQLLSFALVEFKSVKEALLIFLLLQHKRIGHQRLLLGFGHLMDFSKPEMAQIRLAGFLNVFSPAVGDWNLSWCFASETTLTCYQNLQNEDPSLTFDLRNSIVCSRGPTSIEIYDPQTQSSCFCFNHSRFEMAEWWKVLCDASNGTLTPIASEMSASDVFITCSTCNESIPLAMTFVGDYGTEPSCRSCLRGQILPLLEEEPAKISELFSIMDLRSLLDRQDFDKFLDLSLYQLLSSDDAAFISCPTCASQWEFVRGDAEDAPDFSRELGLDGRILDEDARRHYLSHRVCCRNCGDNFCWSCNTIPYHCGFDCEIYQVYKAAEKCRFCSVALMPNTISKDSMDQPEPLRNVCNNGSCLAKRNASCDKILPCGHFCHGVSGEETCAGCLVLGCEGRWSYMTQHADDFCNICFTEPLEHGPCLELDCGHLFHEECIQKKLCEKWSGPAVTFGCAKCPLCANRIAHPSLKQYLEPIQKVHRELENMAHFQLKEESMLDAPELSDPDDPFFEDMVGFALHKFAFYDCFVCQSPYYGGLQQCLDGLAAVNAEDFICPACSGIGLESCAIHGREYMVYKCRFCCSVATYFCWGSTHFCPDCHRRQENHDYITTKSKDELPQCNGPENCPLRVDHPENGEEFSLGCSLCRGTDAFGQIHPTLEHTDPPQGDEQVPE